MTTSFARASSWMLFGNVFQSGAQIIIFVLLARILTPVQFGIMAACLVGVDTLGVVVRCGQLEVLQQRPRISDKILQHSFQILILGGVVATHLCIISGAVYQMNAGDSPIPNLLFILSAVPFIESIGIIPDAILRRQMKFKVVTMRNNLAAIAAGLLALLAAYLGAGVYALAIQRLTVALFRTIIVWRLNRFSPRWHGISRPLFVGLVNQGFLLAIPSISMTVGPRIMDGMVGLYLGTSALGTLRMTFRVFDLVSQLTIVPIAQVATAYFPSIVRDRERFVSSYLASVRLIGLVALPLFTALAVTAQIWLPLALGAHWANTVTPLKILSLVSIALVINNLQTPSLIALRANTILFWQGLAQIPMHIVCTAAGLPWGVNGVIFGFLVREYLTTLFNFYMLSRLVDLSIPKQLTTLYPALLAVGVVVVVSTITIPPEVALTPYPALESLFKFGVLAAPIYGLASWRHLPQSFRAGTRQRIWQLFTKEGAS